ncbi:hypothetical protein TUM12370_12450 [Salmonella enterica subsp. enterica serovar Choleraesuis]|nr:hypothetical protein TUM12370_12450 [Salmonella enterica subsp. enterica serovar Choleraesuis]
MKTCKTLTALAFLSLLSTAAWASNPAPVFESYSAINHSITQPNLAQNVRNDNGDHSPRLLAFMNTQPPGGMRA